jgi:hypothetical protein
VRFMTPFASTLSVADYSEQHRLPLKEGTRLLQALLGDKSALRSEKTRIHFFSEGEAKLFHKFRTAFPEAVFHLGNQSTMLQDLDHLAAAGEKTDRSSAVTFIRRDRCFFFWTHAQMCCWAARAASRP